MSPGRFIWSHDEAQVDLAGGDRESVKVAGACSRAACSSDRRQARQSTGRGVIFMALSKRHTASAKAFSSGRYCRTLDGREADA
jgi:hypothetical protein